MALTTPTAPQHTPSGGGLAGLTGRTARQPELATPRPPRARLALGTLLVAAAAVGTAALISKDASSNTELVLVARHDMTPGSPIGANDVELVAIDVPTELLARAVRNPDTLDRPTYVAADLHTGDIVTAGDLARIAPVGEEFSVELTRAAALGGRVSAGDRVAFLITREADGLPTAIEAVVTHVDSASATLSGGRTIWLSALVATRAEAAAVQASARAGTLGLVRSQPGNAQPGNGAPPGNGSGDAES